MRILYITPKPTFPCDDGSRRASKNLLSALSSLGVEIDVVSFFSSQEKPNTDQTLKELGLKSVNFIPYPKFHVKRLSHVLKAIGGSLLPPFLPATASPFAHPSTKSAFLEYIASKTWDFCVWDGLHGAACLYSSQGFLIPKNLGIPVYRAQNVESDLWKTSRQNTKNIVKKFVFLQQEKVMQRFEQGMCAKAKIVATVSQEDCKRFTELHSFLPEWLIHIPIGFPFPAQFNDNKYLRRQEVNQPSNILRLLFLGKLDWAPNQEGLSWFLKHVWPKAYAQRPELRLRIVGSGDASWLLPVLQNLAGVEHIGRVHDLQVTYDSTDASLVPIFSGSGTRVKAIEAVVSGCALIGTRLGIESAGLNAGDHYFAAESARDWLEILLNISVPALHQKARSAFFHLESTYEAAKVAEKFLSSLRLAQD